MADFEQISRLMNSEVRDRSGEHSGQVKDVLVDAVEGRIEYVLLALPPAGLRRVRYVTVPWSVFADAEEVDGRCHIRVRREALERMPAPGGKRFAAPGRSR